MVDEAGVGVRPLREERDFLADLVLTIWGVEEEWS